MKAAGSALVIGELLADKGMTENTPLYIGTEDGLMPVTESDDGTLTVDSELFTFSYQDAHDLLTEIADDPEAWTKKKIMTAITSYLGAS